MLLNGWFWLQISNGFDSKSHPPSAILGSIPQENTLGPKWYHKEAVRCKDVVTVKARESKAHSLKVWVVKRSWIVIGRTFLLLLFQIKNNFKCVGLGKEGLGMKKDGARSQEEEKGHGITNTCGGTLHGTSLWQWSGRRNSELEKREREEDPTVGCGHGGFIQTAKRGHL